MLASGLATSIALVTLFASGIIGFIFGFITSKVLRIPWAARMAATDTLLAAVVAVAAAFALAAVALIRGQFDPGLKWILIISAGSVVVRHLIRFARSADAVVEDC